MQRDYQPVPTAYYGVSNKGDIKVRGLEIRNRSQPKVVKNLQEEIILEIDKVLDENDLRLLLKRAVRILKNHISSLDSASPDDLAMKVRICREDYSVNCIQKIMKDRIKILRLGESVYYIIEDYNKRQYATIQEYRGVFDKDQYSWLLRKAAAHLFLVFGTSESFFLPQRQAKIEEFEIKYEKMVLVNP